MDILNFIFNNFMYFLSGILFLICLFLFSVIINYQKLFKKLIKELDNKNLHASKTEIKTDIGSSGQENFGYSFKAENTAQVSHSKNLSDSENIVTLKSLKSNAKEISDNCKTMDFNFDIENDDEGFHFIVKDNKNNLMGSSRSYKSRGSCLRALINIKNLIPSRISDNENKDKEVYFGENVFEINKIDKGGYYFEIKNIRNIFFKSREFNYKEDCLKEIEKFKKSNFFQYFNIIKKQSTNKGGMKK